MESSTGRRYLLWLAISFLCGIFYGLRNHIPAYFIPSFLWYSGIFLLFLGLFFILLTFLFRKMASPDLVLLWFLLLSFCLGIFRVSYFASFQFQSLQATAGKTRQYVGVVLDTPQPSSSEKTLGFPVKVLYTQEDDEKTYHKGKIYLYAKPELSSHLQYGDVISFSGNLTPPIGAPFPGGFSNRDRLYSQGFLFSEYTQELSLLEETYSPTPFDRFQRFGRKLQQNILSTVDQTFGASSKESALLKGILLGYREDFTAEQYQNFVDSGLVHITSVSGMHVMFLVAFLSFLFRKLRFPKFLAHLLLAATLIIFCAMAAFTASVCRAVILALLVILAQSLQREPDTLTSLSLAAVILLIVNPYTMTSYSFILSFSSALGLLLLAQPINHFLHLPFSKTTKEGIFHSCLQKIRDITCNSFSVSLACTLGVGYFSARFFHRISWGSLFANLFLLPLISAVFILGFCNCLLAPFSPALSGLLANYPLRFLLLCINHLAEFFAHPIFLISTGTPPESAIIPYFFFLFALREKAKKSLDISK